MTDETDKVFDETTPEAEPVPATTEELLQQLLDAQKQHRAEVAALREEFAKSRTPQPQRMDVFKTAEQLLEERIAEVRQHSHYCPGCGRLSTYMRECNGRAEAPHPPIDMVSTEELLGDDPTAHTPAPSSENLG